MTLVSKPPFIIKEEEDADDDAVSWGWVLASLATVPSALFIVDHVVDMSCCWKLLLALVILTSAQFQNLVMK